jgi:hypothetical protein
MFAMAPTDIDWYNFFRNNPVPNEVNFWTPTPWNIKKMTEGDKLLFLLKSPYRKVCGYGSFKYYENLTINEAWERFETGNGVESLIDLKIRCSTYNKKYLSTSLLNDEKREIGCIVLTDVIFFSEEDFISTEELDVSFPRQVVKLKYYDMKLPEVLEGGVLHLAEEVTDEETLIEGAKKQITVNAYERNPLARQRCLNHYGYSCTICKFNFSNVYGDIGNDFIHVHHLKELNQIGEEYEVDPINDLRPVCPNCHAMLHKRKPAYTIEELKEKIN